LCTELISSKVDRFTSNRPKWSTAHSTYRRGIFAVFYVQYWCHRYTCVKTTVFFTHIT